jgi:large subunit ribosomal protein L9
MIEVILLERIDRLGQLGQVVKVRPGFARNFLLPQNKAMRATKANLEHFEKERAGIEARNADDRAKAEMLAKKMDKMKLVIIRQASESGQLYGSVSARDIADAAKQTQSSVERSMVYIDAPIKTLGLFPIKIKLHPEVSVTVTINIARSVEEAQVQFDKGAAIIKAEAEKAEVIAAMGAPAEEPAEAAAKPTKKKKAKADDSEAAPEADAEEATAKPKKAKAKKAAEA